MGGFTVNGCGVGDSFYPQKGLGLHFCKSCRSKQDFVLMEVRRKIKVFFIPTVSINVKYAVGCAKCKSGYYIDDKWKDALMNSKATIQVEDDGIRLLMTNNGPDTGGMDTSEMIDMIMKDL
ncbi:MAG: zinc-ribbon domain-containing protein [Eubacteriales bacterium]|nr:zinc-ribbon domain-containing protein [Eubacteriales bacterium]